MRAARHIAQTDIAQTDIALEATYLGPDSANFVLSAVRHSGSIYARPLRRSDVREPIGPPPAGRREMSLSNAGGNGYREIARRAWPRRLPSLLK
jgi:hypothetical protein